MKEKESSDVGMVHEIGDLEAVRTYVRLGTLAAVSREMNLPLKLLQQWSRTTWWQDEVVLLRREQNAHLDALLTKLHDMTVEEMLDRVEFGEKRIVGKGKLQKLVRVPVSAAVLSTMSEKIFTQRQLLREQPTAIQGDTGRMQTLADKLKMLGKTLAVEKPDGVRRMIGDNGQIYDVVDVEVSDAEETRREKGSSSAGSGS